MVGNGDALGNWNPWEGSVELSTTEKDVDVVVFVLWQMCTSSTSTYPCFLCGDAMQDYPLWKSGAIELSTSTEYKYVPWISLDK